MERFFLKRMADHSYAYNIHRLSILLLEVIPHPATLIYSRQLDATKGPRSRYAFFSNCVLTYACMFGLSSQVRIPFPHHPAYSPRPG